MYLDSGSVSEPTGALCPVPIRTRHNGATSRPDPRTMGRSDPTRKMNSRILDSEGRGLIRSRGLWYFPVQAKRPFIIPIPKFFLTAIAEMISVANDGIVRKNTGFHTVPGLKTPVKLTILVCQTRS